MPPLCALLDRSISIFDSNANMMWESGDFMETYMADEANGYLDFFNSQGSKCREHDNKKYGK